MSSCRATNAKAADGRRGGVLSAASLQLMTASRARCARSCRRRHQLQYLLGYRPAESVHSLRFGQLVHDALEAWWLAAKAKLPVEEWHQAAMRALSEREADELDLAHAQVMMMGYHLRWSGEPYEVLAVEVEFNAPLRNPVTGAASRTWRLAGKIDVVVRDLRTSEVVIIEHKTSSEDLSPTSDYWKRLRMDGQVSTYFEGAKSLGYEAARCLYDVLGKPRHGLRAVPVVDEHGVKVVHDADGNRVKTAQGKWRQTASTADGYVLQTRPETLDEHKARLVEELGADPQRYWCRGDVVRLDAELQGALLDTWQLAQSLREEQLADRYPRNPDACMAPGRTCPFFAVCAGEASLEDERFFIRSTDVHPELAGHVAEGPKEEAPYGSTTGSTAVDSSSAATAHVPVEGVDGEAAAAPQDSAVRD